MHLGRLARQSKPHTFDTRQTCTMHILEWLQSIPEASGPKGGCKVGPASLLLASSPPLPSAAAPEAPAVAPLRPASLARLSLEVPTPLPASASAGLSLSGACAATAAPLPGAAAAAACRSCKQWFRDYIRHCTRSRSIYTKSQRFCYVFRHRAQKTARRGSAPRAVASRVINHFFAPRTAL